MGKKQLVVAIIFLCIAGVVGIDYLFFIKRDLPSVNGPDVGGQLGTGNHSDTEGNNTNPPTGAVLPRPPQDYAVLVDNEPAMRAEFREASKRKFNEVIETLREHPDSLWAWLDLASIKKSFNDLDGAEAIWLYATKLYPNHTVAYQNLGQLYWHNKIDYPKAEIMFLKVVELDITAVGTYRDLADLYRYNYTAKKDQVDDLILKGLKDNSEDPDLLSYLAFYYYETGDLANSIKIYERLVKANPSNTQAREDLEDLKAGRPIGSPN